MKYKFIAGLLVSLIPLLSFNVLSAEKPAAFKIDSIIVSNSQEAHFRITDSGGWHCHNGPKAPAWSFINENDPGAKAMMSALLAAYASDYTVKIQTIGATSGSGERICRIVEFEIIK